MNKQKKIQQYHVESKTHTTMFSGGWVSRILWQQYQGLSTKKRDDGGMRFKKCPKLRDVIYGRSLLEKNPILFYWLSPTSALINQSFLSLQVCRLSFDGPWLHSLKYSYSPCFAFSLCNIRNNEIAKKGQD